jgi:sulfur carrier protein ThiS
MGRAYYVRGLQRAESVELEPGTTPYGLLGAFGQPIDPAERPVICLVDNEPVLRKDWDLTIPDDSVVEFVELPQGGGGGGGSNPLQLIMTVVIGVVAVVSGNLWAASLLKASVFGEVGSAVMGGLLTAGIMLAGNLIMGAIFKGPALPSGHLNASYAEQASPTYGLNASNNQARLYQPIGEGFGRIQIVPDRAAQAYAQYIGNDMYLYQVFGLGRGSYRVESMAFGDSVFWREGSGTDSAYEVEVQLCEPGESVTLFPDNVETSIEVSGQQLLSPLNEEFTGPLGPFSANPPGTLTDRIVFNFTFPQGLGKYADDGSLQEITVTLLAEAQVIDDYGVPSGEWAILFEQSYTYGTLTAQRFSVEANVAQNRYQVRVARTDEAEGDGRLMDSCTWESLFSFLPGTLSYNQSTVALKTKATNALSQQAASTFSVIYTRLLPEYDPESKAWSEPKPTRKLASALSWVLGCEWGGGLPDRRIDLESLWGDIQPILDENGWTFDGYFDGAYKVWTLILEMCQAFRVVPRITNGGVSFVYDRSGRPVRHVFTPRDIMRGSLSVTYNTFTDDTPDNMIWSYLDEDAGYQAREVQCQLPDSKTDNPVIKSFIGCVKRKQAFEMGVFAVACNRHRRISLKFSVEALGRLLLMGDVCAVSHPYFASLGCGAVKGADESDLRVDLGAVVDEEKLEGDAYLSIELPDGKPFGPCRISRFEDGSVFLDAGDLALLKGQGQGDPFEAIERAENGQYTVAWTLESGKDFMRRIIIQSVSPSDATHYEITAINDSADVDSYGDLPVPIWDQRGQGGALPDVEPTAPDGFSCTVTTSGNNATVNLTWLPVPGAANYAVEVMGPGASEYVKLNTYVTNAAVIRTTLGEVSVRVKATNHYGIEGPWGVWTQSLNDYFEPEVPFTVTDFTGGTLRVTWQNPPVEIGQASYVFHYYYLWFTRKGQPSSILRTAKVTADQDPKPYTGGYSLQMQLADGGPYRELDVYLKLIMTRSDPLFITQVESATYFDSVSDPAPKLTGEPAITPAATSISLDSAPVDGECTGYVIVRGDGAGFQLANVRETRIAASLPFVWTGLSPATEYHFRIAPKDAFADVTASYGELVYSPSVSVKTSEA